MNDNINPFQEEFNKTDVIENNSNDKNEPLLTLEDLELYDEQEFLNKKFKNIVDDPNIQKISSIPDELKDFIDDSQFSDIEDYYKLRDEIILQKHFKDFLLLRRISGQIHGISDSNRIPSYKIKEIEKVFIEDDPIVTDFDEESKSLTTVITHKNELDEIQYIEVLCSCGSKTVIKFEYDNKSEVFSPASYKPEDYDPQDTLYAFDMPLDELEAKFSNDEDSKQIENSPENIDDLNDSQNGNDEIHENEDLSQEINQAEDSKSENEENNEKDRTHEIDNNSQSQEKN